MKPRTDITRFGKIKNKTKNWYSFSGNKTIALNAQKKASKRLTRERERERAILPKKEKRERELIKNFNTTRGCGTALCLGSPGTPAKFCLRLGFRNASLVVISHQRFGSGKTTFIGSLTKPLFFFDE